MQQPASLPALHLPTVPFYGPALPGLSPSGQKARPCATLFASKGGRDAYGWGYDGRQVDESMIVLRKRIHEIRMAEGGSEPPREWMEWEKKYANESYDSDICLAMGWIQSALMQTRPSLALGMVALVALSVPASTVAVVIWLMELVNGMFFNWSS
ncbi:hypothetical protein NMG60_11018861 [Bertholletia excelsa]